MTIFAQVNTLVIIEQQCGKNHHKHMFSQVGQCPVDKPSGGGNMGKLKNLGNLFVGQVLVIKMIDGLSFLTFERLDRLFQFNQLFFFKLPVDIDAFVG
jgi:hypothetical protein